MKNLDKMSDFDLYQAKEMIEIISMAYLSDIIKNMRSEIEAEYKNRNIIAPLAWDFIRR